MTKTNSCIESCINEEIDNYELNNNICGKCNDDFFFDRENSTKKTCKCKLEI